MTTETLEPRFALGQECEHGQLARSCGLCDRDYEIAELRAQVADLRKENDWMRASLANGGGPCSYCKLPREQWASCARGFPGCPRGDDAMLCPHVGAGLQEEELRAQVAQYKEDAERWRWAIKHAEWHRSERAAYISIPVDRAADLSCHATRIAAIDKARKTT